jgi:DNA-binding transcriptional MerR regulator
LLHLFPVSSSEPTSNLPSSALREFTKCSKADWDGGVPLPELLERINRVAECLPTGSDRPGSGTGRVSRIFTERTFRHYQTLGCIDVPEKHGRNASYGYRHFLQALLIRRLLADGVPARRMQELVSGSGDELKRMILGGVEMVMRPGGSEEVEERPSQYQQVLRACAENSVSGWIRVALGEGIEIHLSDKRPKMTTEQRRQMLKRIEEFLR